MFPKSVERCFREDFKPKERAKFYTILRPLWTSHTTTLVESVKGMNYETKLRRNNE
jgi:hypothetical protein